MILYLDASGVVKLSIFEDGTPVAEAAWQAADHAVTSRITLPECRAALAAAERSGRLTMDAHRRAKRNLTDRLSSTQIVEVSELVADRASHLAERRALRGFDAVHLASAQILGPAHILTWDTRLREAALAEGLGVVPA